MEYVHGWETRWKNNITHYLWYGLCRNVVLPHHVCIVFLLKQPISTSWCSQATNHHLNNWLIQTIVIGWFDENTIHTWWGRATFLHKPRPNIDNEFQWVSKPCILLTVVILTHHIFRNGLEIWNAEQTLDIRVCSLLSNPDIKLL